MYDVSELTMLLPRYTVPHEGGYSARSYTESQCLKPIEPCAVVQSCSRAPNCNMLKNVTAESPERDDSLRTNVTT